MEFKISELVSMLIKRLWILLLCIVLGTAGAFAAAKLFVDEKYTSSVSMYVAPGNSDTDIYASLNFLNYAKQVVNTYIEILRTNAFLDSAAKASGLDYSAAELKKMVAINVVNNTEIFRVRVTTTDPEESLLLADTIARLAPRKIIEIKNADAVKVVDPAILPAKPSSPNLLLSSAMGFALGLLLGAIITVMLELLDKRIKDEEDLLKRYSVPLLGTVPMMEEQ